MEKLLDHSAHAQPGNHGGHTALDMAAGGGHLYVVNVLLERGPRQAHLELSGEFLGLLAFSLNLSIVVNLMLYREN